MTPYSRDLRDADRDYLAQIEKSRAELHSYTKEKVDEASKPEPPSLMRDRLKGRFLIYRGKSGNKL